jgi:signal peptidase I
VPDRDPFSQTAEAPPDPLAPQRETEPPAQVPSGPSSTRDQRKGRKDEARGSGSFFKELPVLLLIAFVLALLIKSFLVQAFYIPSESMERTLRVGDRVLVNKVVYHLHPPRRGDIIVFEEPHPAKESNRNPLQGFWHWLTQGLGVSTDPEKDFIKRVVGLPGETLEIKRGEVFIDGQKLAEPYLGVIEDIRDYGPVKVPPDNLFVMGDNRTNSNDSRFGLGFIPYRKVVGRAFVVIWPPGRIHWIRTIHA